MRGLPSGPQKGDPGQRLPFLSNTSSLRQISPILDGRPHLGTNEFMEFLVYRQSGSKISITNINHAAIRYAGPPHNLARIDPFGSRNRMTAHYSSRVQFL